MFSDNKNLKSGIKRDDDFIPVIPMEKPYGILWYMTFPELVDSQSCTETRVIRAPHTETTVGKIIGNYKNNINGTGE